MQNFPLGNRGINLEIAIAGYKIILIIFTETDLPIDWAMTQNNLANTYFNRIKGDRAENLEMAIASYHQALRIYTETDFPLEWAMSQNNLASAYSNRIKGDRAENLEMAIASYHNALRIYTPEELPIECLQTSRNLGNLHFTVGKWALAIKAYDRAINAVETSHICATKDDRCQEIIAELIKVYEKIVRACINNQQIGKAVEYVKRSLSPRLVDLMVSNNLYANGNIPEQVQEYLREYEDL
jgi:tetratricopeptide (TPR) repeat protein